MNFKSPAVLLIIVSLVAAAAILVSSAFLGEKSDVAMFIIIAIWWIPFSILAVHGKNEKSKDEMEVTKKNI